MGETRANRADGGRRGEPGKSGSDASTARAVRAHVKPTARGLDRRGAGAMLKRCVLLSGSGS